MSIYVEIRIHGEMDDLWAKTQEPALHERRDLRFSEIAYLPRGQGEPQRFLYETRIGAGLRIRGEGESTGERNNESGERTSALKFWSTDPKSLIESGSGYWKYIPEVSDLRFLTWYDYRTRFGTGGRIVDRLLFRPMIGWATAWSFDRLRLWVENGIPPEAARNNAIVYALTRLAVALVWIYQGFIPKVLFHSYDEVQMLHDIGVRGSLRRTASFVGVIEICIGIVLLLFWRSRWPLWFTILAMFGALAAVWAYSPRFITAAFNPVTPNMSVVALAFIALIVHRSTPTARRCMRKTKENGE